MSKKSKWPQNYSYSFVFPIQGISAITHLLPDLTVIPILELMKLNAYVAAVVGVLFHQARLA